MERYISKVYFGYRHKLEMDNHIAMLNCHKRYTILDDGYSANCHNLTLNKGYSKRSDIFNIGYS